MGVNAAIYHKMQLASDLAEDPDNYTPISIPPDSDVLSEDGRECSIDGIPKFSYQ